MGFSDRNSMAGRLSSISFPDALKRGASDSATQFTIQITDSNGSPNDPDSAQLYVRVTNAAGVAQDGLLYTDSGLSSAVGASSNATYNNGSSAFWKAASSSSGAVTLFHKTGTASNLEGIYHLEYAWFENDEAVSGSHMFRIVDLADLDDVNVNVGSDSDSSSASGSVHAKIKDVKAAVAGLNDPTAAANADAVWDEAISGHSGSGSTGAALADVLADTNALQGDWANGGRLDVILDAAATATALATVDGNVDDIEAAVGALGDAASADYGTSRTAMAMLRKLGADVATVDGVADAVLVDTGTTLPATLGSPAGSSLAADIAALKAVSDGIQTDLSNGTDGLGALKTLIDAVDVVADAVLVDTGTTLPATLGSPAGASMSADIAAIKSDTAAAVADLANGTDGLGALKALVDTVDTVVDGIQTDLSNGTDGLGALKTLIDAVDVVADAVLVDTGTTLPATLGSPAGADMSTDIAAIKSDTAATVADLANGTDGLGALKSLIDNVQTAVNAVQNNTRFVAAIPGKINRPASGAEAVAIACYLYDEAGNMEDPDSNGLFVKISQMDGSAVTGRYFSDSGLSSAISASGSGTFSGYFPLGRVSSGKYAFFYKNDTGHDEENLAIEFGWEEGSTARYQGRAMQVSDAADLDTIKSTVDGIQTDLSNGTDGLGALKTLIDTVDTVADAVLVDTGTTLPATLGSPAGASMSADIAAIKSDTAAAVADLANGTDGLGALKSLIDTVDGNVDDIEAAVGALGDAASADYGTTRTAMAMLRKIGADIATADAVADGIQADLSNGTDGLGALKTLIDTVDTVADAILVDTGTTLPATLGSPAGANMSADIAAIKSDTAAAVADLANGTDGLGALKSLIDTADAAIDAVQVDVGDFSGNTNLQSLKAVVGSRLEARNVALDTLLMLGNMSIYKVASNSHSGGSGTFTLTTIGSGYHSVPTVNDSFVGGSFSVLAGSNVGRVVMASDFVGGSGQVSYGGLSLADDDVIAFFPPSGYVGKSDDAAAASASDAGKSLFARLRYIGELVSSQKAVQRSTFKKHLKRSTAGTLGNDPTDNAESASSTTTSASFEILDVVTISFDEGSDASIEDIFAVFKWKHQGTNGGSGGAISTQFYLSGGASAPSAGAALSGVGDAVAVSDAISGTTSASTQSVSGLINQNALDAFSNGKIHVLLCGKAASAGDTCTGWIYHSSSLEITYEV